MANQAIGIKISNLAQIKHAFGLAPGLMTNELNLAIKKTLYTIQGRSMRNTPVDTGRLRASTKSLFGNLKGEVGTHTNYDIFVHWGTKYMKGRPYLLQAVDESGNETNMFFLKAVDNVLSRIGRMT